MRDRCLFLVLALLLTPVSASEVEELIVGGRIYDKWWVDAGLTPPDSTHTAYKDGKKSGNTTWRCKECHGWDYRGKDGAYSKGSHYSGIKGIREAEGRSVEQIRRILENTQHGYGKYLTGEHLNAVSRFVSKGQIDMTKYISYDTKQVKGDAKEGKRHYKKYCLDCHGKAGDTMNLASGKSKAEYVGTIANKNPWETLHKIRFGHPGAVMDMKRMHNSRQHHSSMRKMWEHMPPMLGVLSEKEQVDLLAYLQTLSM
ncbi:MAG: cytochrome c [Gammaproteobacteria bacterium]|nr:cytochrome c [Gammaproteobacteria bacterium]MDH5802753.1 cytochrome c [Gammaproteobacteria bacterium]